MTHRCHETFCLMTQNVSWDTFSIESTLLLQIVMHGMLKYSYNAIHFFTARNPSLKSFFPRQNNLLQTDRLLLITSHISYCYKTKCFC